MVAPGQDLMKETRQPEPLEQRLELLLGHTALANDSVHRAARQVSMMHRNHGAELPLGVNEEEMACAALAVFDKASLL